MEPTFTEILDLAVILGKSEQIDPHWILYPAWATRPPEHAVMLRLGEELRKRAYRILRGEDDLPAWIAREYPFYAHLPVPARTADASETAAAPSTETAQAPRPDMPPARAQPPTVFRTLPRPSDDSLPFSAGVSSAAGPRSGTVPRFAHRRYGPVFRMPTHRGGAPPFSIPRGSGAAGARVFCCAACFRIMVRGVCLWLSGRTA